MAHPHILLTGRPGMGKTTVIMRTLALVGDLQPSGFYTREVRSERGRLGFEAISLDGTVAMLAHVGFSDGPRVGRYGVDVTTFEREIVSSIDPLAQTESGLLVVDEIGKMECLSPRFVATARRALAGPIPVFGTIAAWGGGFIAEVKAMPNVRLVEVTAKNRDDLPRRLATELRVASGRAP